MQIYHLAPVAGLIIPTCHKLGPYCWWKKSCTTWDVWNPVNNGIFSISTGAGFLPSTVWWPLIKPTELESCTFELWPPRLEDQYRPDSIKPIWCIYRNCRTIGMMTSQGPWRCAIYSSNWGIHNSMKFHILCVGGILICEHVSKLGGLQNHCVSFLYFWWTCGIPNSS